MTWHCGRTTAQRPSSEPFYVAVEDCDALDRGDHVTLALIGHHQGETYLRVTYPRIEKGPPRRQVIRYQVVKVKGTRAQLVGAPVTLSAASQTGSILEFEHVETDRFDLAASNPTNVTLYYWKESEHTDQAIPARASRQPTDR